MGKVVIRYVVSDSGERKVIVSYHGDPGDLPVEHEDNHRRVVDALIEGGLAAAADAGEVVVERGVPAAPHSHEHERPAEAEVSKRRTPA
jgi:hypothetical protein